MKDEALIGLGLHPGMSADERLAVRLEDVRVKTRKPRGGGQTKESLRQTWAKRGAPTVKRPSSPPGTRAYHQESLDMVREQLDWRCVLFKANTELLPEFRKDLHLAAAELDHKHHRRHHIRYYNALSV